MWPWRPNCVHINACSALLGPHSTELFCFNFKKIKIRQKSKKPRLAAGAAPRKGPHTSVTRSPAQIFSSRLRARALVILPKSAVFWAVWMEVCASSCHPK